MKKSQRYNLNITRDITNVELEKYTYHLTEDVAAYMSIKFQSHFSKSNEESRYLIDDWTLEFIQDINLAVDVLISAYKNKKSTSWSAEEYAQQMTVKCTGRNHLVEEKLTRNFPPIFTPTVFIADPCVITDKEDRCLFWYLPGILTETRAARAWGDLELLSGILSINTNSKSWRSSAEYCNNKNRKHNPGVATFAPAWFQQGHEKSKGLEVSKNLRTEEANIWLKRTMQYQAIIAGILRIIDPLLFRVGMWTLSSLFDHAKGVGFGHCLDRILEVWGTPFSVISVIRNRDTPFHRDNGSDKAWFDILSALGKYTNGRFELPGLGIRVKYNAGTVVAILSKVLRHGAICNGDRACIAFYMRKSVLRFLGITQPEWVNYNDVVLV